MKESFRIIYYHEVIANPKLEKNVVSTTKFKNQLLYLKKRYEIIDLDTALAMLDQGESLKGKLALTFDDGLYSNYKYALPILEDLKIKATFFLINNCLDNKNLMWRNKIFKIQELKDKNIIQKVMNKCQSQYNLKLESNDLALWSIKHWPMSKKDELADYMWNNSAMPDLQTFLFENRLYMNTKEIQELLDMGFSIGSHSYTHPLCNKLNKDELNYEILDSLTDLSQRFNRNIKLFAYPFGKRPDLELEKQLITTGKLDVLLGIVNKLDNFANPYEWERDNMELSLLKSYLRFSFLFEVYQRFK